MKTKYLIAAIFALFITSVSFAQISSDNLILDLPFTSSAEDESGNMHPVSVFGAQPTVDRFGNENGAYYFDGTDDYMEILPITDLSELGDFTISIWFLQNDWQQQPGTINNVLDQNYVFNGHAHSNTTNTDYFRDGFNIVLYLQEDQTTFIRNTTYDQDGSTYQNNLYTYDNLLNSWHHNVLVRKGNKTYHYIDGNIAFESDNDEALLNMDHSLYLGTFSGNNPNYANFNYNFNGSIDDVKIFDRAITDEEVKILYESVVSNVEEIIEVNSVTIFPNPVTDVLNLHIDQYDPSAQTEFKIYNPMGQVVRSGKIRYANQQIEVADLGLSGVYFIQITLDAKLLQASKIIFVGPKV